MKKPPRSAAAVQKSNLLLAMIGRNFKAAYGRGDFVAALHYAEQAQRLHPQSLAALSDRALCHLKLGAAQKAVDLALPLGQSPEASLALLDILSEAYGTLGDFEAMRLWGRKALQKRDQIFGQSQPAALPKTRAKSLPPPPSRASKAKNIIAYTLFGDLPKYCETAVLNTQLAPQIYPDWSLVIYLDDSVPDHVVARLKENGAQLIFVGPEMKKWPAPMWRFAAYDLPDLDRVIFRDADALLSPREALSVADWIASGRAFHHMRDAPSHSELLLAGLWGTIGGALPPMAAAIRRFLAKGVESAHFADQYFLREYVWPYARADLFENDSLFGAFADQAPADAALISQAFAEGPYRESFHVGCAEMRRIDIACDLPEGSRARWSILEGAQRRPRCHYLGPVKAGAIEALLPSRYVDELEKGEIIITCAPA